MELSYPAITKGPGLRNLITRARAVYRRDNPEYVRWYSGGGDSDESQMMKRARLESDLEYRAFEQEKFQIQEQRQRERLEFDKQKQEYDANKDLVYKSIELLNTAKSEGNDALQKNIIAGMESYFYQLDPRMRELINPIIESGPFSAQETKLRKWDNMNPAPVVDADFEKQPYLAAAQIGAAEDHRARRASFATGSTVPPRELIPLTKEVSWYKGSFVTNEDLDAEGFAKEFKMTTGEVKAQGGYQGPTKEMKVGGKVLSYRYEQSWPGRKTEVKYLGEKPTEEMKGITDFVSQLSVWEDLKDSEKESAKNSLIASVYKKIDDEDWTPEMVSERITKPRFGYNIVQKDDKSWQPVPGQPDIIEGAQVYVDADGGVYYRTSGTSSSGEFIGTLEEATNLLRRQREKHERMMREEEERKRLHKENLKRLKKETTKLYGRDISEEN